MWDKFTPDLQNIIMQIAGMEGSSTFRDSHRSSPGRKKPELFFDARIPDMAFENGLKPGLVQSLIKLHDKVFTGDRKGVLGGNAGYELDPLFRIGLACLMMADNNKRYSTLKSLRKTQGDNLLDTALFDLLPAHKVELGSFGHEIHKGQNRIWRAEVIRSVASEGNPYRNSVDSYSGMPFLTIDPPGVGKLHKDSYGLYNMEFGEAGRDYAVSQPGFANVRGLISLRSNDVDILDTTRKIFDSPHYGSFEYLTLPVDNGSFSGSSASQRERHAYNLGHTLFEGLDDKLKYLHLYTHPQMEDYRNYGLMNYIILNSLLRNNTKLPNLKYLVCSSWHLLEVINSNAENLGNLEYIDLGPRLESITPREPERIGTATQQMIKNIEGGLFANLKYYHGPGHHEIKRALDARNEKRRYAERVGTVGGPKPPVDPGTGNSGDKPGSDVTPIRIEPPVEPNTNWVISSQRNPGGSGWDRSGDNTPPRRPPKKN